MEQAKSSGSSATDRTEKGVGLALTFQYASRWLMAASNL
jgi:hypothetical protein